MGRRQNRGLAKVRCLRHDNIQMSTVQMMMTSISALIAVIVLILISFTLIVPTYNTHKSQPRMHRPAMFRDYLASNLNNTQIDQHHVGA
jgi:hypothetical protein